MESVSGQSKKTPKKASKMRVVFGGMADGSDINTPANQDRIARALIQLAMNHQGAADAAD